MPKTPNLTQRLSGRAVLARVVPTRLALQRPWRSSSVRSRGRRVTAVAVGLLLWLSWSTLTPSYAGTLRAELAAEGRVFFTDPLDPRQHGPNASLRFEPEFYQDWKDGDQRFAIRLFGRLDSGDQERTHADIREAYWRGTFWRQLDVYAGIRTVFWGVTESVHLVDIINQTDLVENLDGEDKLGQPMVSLTWQPDWGTVDFLVMSGFRERTFAGVEGRPRLPFPVDTDNPRYESSNERGQVDVALRYSNYIGDFDFGVAHFSGTGRMPLLQFEPNPGGEPFLVPNYLLWHQTSLDLQYTRGDWAWKIEAVTREILDGRSTGFVGGYEYTLVGLGGSAMDLGLITEYQFDDLDTPQVVSNNDLALGGRLTFNDVQDTDLLAFAAVDLEYGSIFANVEGNRRLGNNWEVELEVRLFLNTDERDLLHAFRNDDYVQLEVVRYF